MWLRSSPRAKGARGFTLVEVLVSLAVLAVVLGSIGSLMAANIRAAGAVEQHLALTETARAMLTALPDRAALATGTVAGELDGHLWRLSVQPYPDRSADKASPSPWEPSLVTMRVQSPSGASLRIDTIRLRRRAPP
jgi:general secretion pathway protein I